MSIKDENSSYVFDVNSINIYNNAPNAGVFYQSMVNRGHKINLQDKLILEKCEGTVQKCGSKRKDIFGSQNIDCHDFYYLLADKYKLNYIYYRLILNSLTRQNLKNMYRYVWVKWEELSDTLYKHYENDDFKDMDEDVIDLIQSIICHEFTYSPEYIDNIYNINKLKLKTLDSFNKFGKKKNIYINFILIQLHKYFIE